MVLQVAFELAAAVPALTMGRGCGLCASFYLLLCGRIYSLKYFFYCRGRTCEYIEKSGVTKLSATCNIAPDVCGTKFLLMSEMFPEWLKVLKADISRHNRSCSIHSERNTTIYAQLYCSDCHVHVQWVWL